MQHADQISIKNGESLGVKKGNVVSIHICRIRCLPYSAVNHLGVSNYSMFTWLISSYIEITLHCEFYNMEFRCWHMETKSFIDSIPATHKSTLRVFSMCETWSICTIPPLWFTFKVRHLEVVCEVALGEFVQPFILCTFEITNADGTLHKPNNYGFFGRWVSK